MNQMIGSNTDNPLISLIVRTMNRPELPEALECIVRQTYNNIEIIIVDATGENKLIEADFDGKFPVRIISKGRHLTIPEAANAGLDEVRGVFFGFLDEDDLISENHVDNLFNLLKDSNAVAAYSNIKMVDKDGLFIRCFNEDYSYEKLLAGNFIPIHALLIRSEVLKKGCRSDESLRIYDDWDFLLQICQSGYFLHLDKTTGIYRNFGTSGVNQNEEMIRFYRTIVYSKWKDKLTAEEYINFIDYLTTIYGKQLYWKKHQQINNSETRCQEEYQINLRTDNTVEQGKRISQSVKESLSSKLTAILRFSKSVIKHNYFFLMPKVQLIKKSGLFDSVYYMQNNPDVIDSGMDVVKHFLIYGGVEGRNPSEKFQSELYLEQNPDVMKSGMNPLVHYIKFGEKEGRSTF